MEAQPHIHSHHIITLPHRGICGILGIARDGRIYAEEIYPPDDWVVQHILTPDGHILASADEAHHPSLLTIPQDLLTPQIHSQTQCLNYQGGRLRGLREEEHLADWAQPLPIADKMHLIRQFGLHVSAMQIFGIVESTVLSSVFVYADWFVVCRRVAFAIALPNVRFDATGLPYDYDSHVFQTAHLYHTSWADFAPIDRVIRGISGELLPYAYDCMIHNTHLYIASGGGNDKNNTIHRWTIEYPAQKG